MCDGAGSSGATVCVIEACKTSARVVCSTESHTLALELAADPAFLYVQDKGSKGSVAQIPVPTVLPGRLLTSGRRRRTSLRLGLRDAFDDRQGLVQENPLMLIDDIIDLGLYAIPNFVETFLACKQLVAEAFEVTLHAELVVRAGISKVETRRNGEISLEDKSELSNDSLSARACMCDQETRF